MKGDGEIRKMVKMKSAEGRKSVMANGSSFVATDSFIEVVIANANLSDI